MSLTLLSYPTYEADGKIYNIFGGYSKDGIAIELKREDIPVVDTTLGADNNVVVRVSGDITANLNQFDSVYLSSGDYDKGGVVRSATYGGTYTEIETNIDWIGAASGGYLNYKQNWFIEAKLVRPDNALAKVVDSTIKTSGNPAGDVTINVENPVDLLDREYPLESGVIKTASIKYRVYYREVWRGDTSPAYAPISSLATGIDTGVYDIINVLSATNPEPETILNDKTLPVSFVGYPGGLTFTHSVLNESGNNDRLLVYFDELDINKNIITEDVFLRDFPSNSEGVFFISSEDIDYTFNQNTRYVNVKIYLESIADYSSDDYDSDDYLTN